MRTFAAWWWIPCLGSVFLLGACRASPPPGQEEYDLASALWLASGAPADPPDTPLLGEDQMLQGLRRFPGEEETGERTTCRALLARLEALGVISRRQAELGRDYTLTPVGRSLYTAYRAPYRSWVRAPSAGSGEKGRRLALRPADDRPETEARTESRTESRDRILKRLLQQLSAYEPNSAVSLERQGWKVRSRKEKP